MSEIFPNSSVDRLKEFNINHETVRAQLMAEFKERQATVVKKSNPARNSLVDNVIGLHGADIVDDEEILDRYEKVANSLLGKRGQPVIVIKRWVDKEGCGGFGGQTEEVLKRTLCVGKLSGEKLKFDFSEDYSIRHRAYLPTAKFVKRGHGNSYTENEPEFVAGSITVSGLDPVYSPDLVFIGSDLDKQLNINIGDLAYAGRHSIDDTIYGPPIKLEIIAGTEDIQKWINERGSNHTYDFRLEYVKIKGLADMLGIKGIEPTKDELRNLYLSM